MHNSLVRIVDSASSTPGSNPGRRVPSPILAGAAIAIAAIAGVRAQSAIRTVPGATGEHLGAAICDAGDVNGDGWHDYLVGAPGANGGRGGVVWVSGRYLATGIAPAQLYSFYPSAAQVSADAAFGWSVTRLGDVTSDNIADFVVGAPFADPLGVADAGMVFLVDGATHAISSNSFSYGFPGDRTGWSVSAAGDTNGDGWPDVLVGAPSTSVQGVVLLFNGREFYMPTSGSIVLRQFHSPTSWNVVDFLGYAVLGGFDFDGDGVRDFAVSALAADNNGADRGVVRIYSGAFGSPVLCDYWGQPGQGMGLALTGGADIDGDGGLDLVVSAFRSSLGSLAAEVIVLSPRHIINGTPPFELFAWDGPTPAQFQTYDFGTSVAIAPDLNGDALPEVLVGLPRWGQASSGSHGNFGAVAIYSSASGARIGWFRGADNERIGTAVCGSIDDLDGDGRVDFVCGGANASVPSSGCGVFKAARMFPAVPNTYCIGKVNSQGCTPAIDYSGSASTTSVSPFLIGASNVINKRNGLLFYGFAPLANPFQGGVLCVQAPTFRTVMQNSGGSATGSDCTGAFSFDFNAFVQGSWHPQLVPGKEVFCQYWSRDPQSPSTTSLSNALGFVVNP
jgi:hypothetical protein